MEHGVYTVYTQAVVRGTTNPAAVLPCITFSVAAQDCQKTTIKPNNKQLDLRSADPFTRIDPKLNQVVPWSLHTFPENFMQIDPAVFS